MAKLAFYCSGDCLLLIYFPQWMRLILSFPGESEEKERTIQTEIIDEEIMAISFGLESNKWNQNIETIIYPNE